MRLGIDAGEHTLTLATEEKIGGVPVSAEQLVEGARNPGGVEGTLMPIWERGLSVCQIGAFGYNPLSSDRESQERQEKILTAVIPLAAQTGCRYIVICGGNYHPSGFGAGDRRNYSEEALDLVAKALEPMLTLAELHDVFLSIEAYLKTAVYSAGSFLSLQDRVRSDHLKVNIDPTSLYKYWDFWDSHELVEKTCTQLTGHYGLVHIKEVALMEGFHIHSGLAPLGLGSTDWEHFLRLIAPHLPEDSWVILEHVLSMEEGRNSLRLLRESAEKAGVVLS